jgi:hypothetical protein
MADDMTNRDTTAEGDAWDEPGSASDRGEKAREWLAQLQSMIEQLATQAAPVVREVGAKAAELAAAAGDKAGPVASRTAELTGRAGQKMAERARGLATELRRDQAAADAAAESEPVAEAAAEEPTEDEPTAMS